MNTQGHHPNERLFSTTAGDTANAGMHNLLQSYMGLFDPTDEDNRTDKKPRHWQDFIVVFVVVGMLFLYILLEWLVF